ncbi:RNA pseudouridine synthase 3 [Cucumis melo var. makuwa]|uniref:RNA pseudouridine synthase 3 n=1 Tax=Cucumis melo var. makuwa TaxID=1194695 RepID=A0A5D3C5S8_CUCMM|nr:RNA pseudouridine synthase 3 [Cucumis melo var. makuwa]
MQRSIRRHLLLATRYYSRISPPPPAYAKPIIRVSNNIAQLGSPKEGPKARQLLSLPPFPGHPLPGKNQVGVSGESTHVTAIRWVKYYFDEIQDSQIQSLFRKGLVQVECPQLGGFDENGNLKPMRKIRSGEIMEIGARIHLPVSVAEMKVSRRFDTIPSGTLYPNADEIKYLQRLVKYKASGVGSLCVDILEQLWYCQGTLPVHNSMDALAAAALSYDYDYGPKLVHRLDRESSGILLMGRTKESVDHLQWLFSNIRNGKFTCKAWEEACNATYQKYWALVIGRPREREGLISAPLSKVLLDDGKTERVVLANKASLEASQEAITEYRVLGPTINGCSWIELCPRTSRKHQLRIHCAEALGTPIVGDYKYGWFVHRRWKQMPRVDVEPISGRPYKLRRPEGLDVQKGSVLSKGRSATARYLASTSISYVL